jgi:hypothetical protein
MGEYLKPVTPLTDVQAKLIAELTQKEAGIRQIIADAQTEYEGVRAVYNAALDKFNADNRPVLIVAENTLNDVIAKMKLEIGNIEDAKRAIRKIEKA